MRKGQITLFIIIGILILIIFAVFYSFFSNQEAEAKRDVVDNSVLRLYIEQCVSDVANEGIKLIGLQGGHVEVKEPFIKFQKDRNEIKQNVSYGYENYSEVNYSAPNYPCKKSGFSDAFECYFAYRDGTLKYPFALYSLPMLNEGNESIKAQLENYIVKNVNTCVMEGVSNNLLPAYSESGDAVAEVRFLPESTLIVYNKTIVQSDGGSVVPTHSFVQEIPVKFDRIYNYAKQLIFNDLVSPVFDISNDYSEITLFLNNYVLESYADVENFKDVFIYYDGESRIEDKPFRFQFARQNFPPVLNYVDQFPSDKLIDIHVNIPDDAGFTYVTINPTAFDMNEDALVFTYSGWRQDYEGTTRSRITDPDRKWMSPGYDSKNGSATIKVDIADLGEWETILTVSDGELTDYQIITIHVED